MALKNKIQMPPLTLWTYRLKQIQRFKFKIKILNDEVESWKVFECIFAISASFFMKPTL